MKSLLKPTLVTLEPTDRGTPPEPDRGFVRDLRRPVFDSISPSYILDPNFQFLDWNPAFYEIFAKPFGFRLGMHATYFLTRFTNCEAVMSRSMDVFAPGKHPIVDSEKLLIDTEKYGVIQAQKFATQIIDEMGRKKAWVVTLNIVKANNLERLWQDIAQSMERDARWSTYGACLDSLCRTFPDYQQAIYEIVHRVKSSQRCLDLHAGIGDVSVRLLASRPDRAVWSIEFNEMMLETLKMKVGQLLNRTTSSGQPSIAKATSDHLEEYSSDSFDSVVTLDGLHRISDIPKCFSEIHRILKPEASFVFSAFHSGTNFSQIIDRLREHLRQTGATEHLEGSLEVFERTLKGLEGELKKFSREELAHLLQAAKLEVTHAQELFSGQAILFECKKRP